MDKVTKGLRAIDLAIKIEDLTPHEIMKMYESTTYDGMALLSVDNLDILIQAIKLNTIESCFKKLDEVTS